MKQNILLITIIILHYQGFTAQARTTLYQTAFTSVPAGLSGPGWQNNSNSPSNYAGASGENHWVSQMPLISTTYTITLNNNISTVGFKNITVSWGGKKSGGGPVTLYYATGEDSNGDNIEDFTQVQGFSDAGTNWYLISVELPVAGVNNLKLRWAYTSSFLDLFGFTTYAIDDIIISADPDPAITPLPVSLISFTAQCEKNRILLHWQTGMEVNNDRFEIQKSLNGKDFNYVGEVKGAASSNNLIVYVFIDQTNLDKLLYYRLKQVDFDGTENYSPIIKVEFLKESSNILTVFPNPANSYLQILLPKELKEFGQTEIVNLAGVAVKVFSNAKTDLIIIEDLAPGIYIVKAKGEKFTYNARFMKQ